MPVTEPQAGIQDILVAMMTRAFDIDQTIYEHRQVNGRCAVCKTGASGSHVMWPCTLYTAAARARRVQDGKDRPKARKEK